MKVTGKITKTESFLLMMAAVFLLAMAGLYAQAVSAAEGTDYTITTERKASQPIAPEPEETDGAKEGAKPVDINTASAEELETLPGIGSVLAQRIIEYRAEHGPFASVEDLLEVKGIGEATLDKFRDQIMVGPGQTQSEDRPAKEADA